MDSYDEGMKRGLVEHLEEGVADVDLWASVQERMVTGYRAQGEMAREAVVDDVNVGVEGVEGVAGRVGVMERVRGWFVPYAWGAVGLVALVVVMTAAVAGLSGREGGGLPSKRTPGPTATAVLAVPQSPYYDYLFTVQGGEDQKSVGIGNGFDVGEDGSFWVGLGEEGIGHYSADGRVLGTLDVTRDVGQISDLELVGDDIWVVQGVYVYKLSSSMVIKEQYEPMAEIPFIDNLDTLDLRLGPMGDTVLTYADGQMLLEESSTGRYFRMANQKRKLDNLDGVDPPLLSGYPSKGDFYSVTSLSGYFGNSTAIMAGELLVPVSVGNIDNMRRLHVLGVRADGSFYVVVEDFGVPNYPARMVIPQGTSIYVLHYDAEGTLLEHGLVSSNPPFSNSAKTSSAYRQISLGPDGNVYAELLVGEPKLLKSPWNEDGQKIVVRVTFYPGDESLPPAPTIIPVNGEPTPVVSVLSPDNVSMFTIPRVEGSQDYSYGNGLGIAEDGSYWLGIGQGLVAHYGTDGKLIRTLGAELGLTEVWDVEVADGFLWVVGDGKLVKLDMEGNVVARYEPHFDIDPDNLMELLMGGPLRSVNGLILVENYLADQDYPDEQYFDLLGQVSGTSGSLREPPTLPGYPGNDGKYYSKVFEKRNGRDANLPGVIVVGKDEYMVDAPGTVTGWHMLKVLPDDSYLLVVEARGFPEPELPAGDYLYVGRYGADGKLLAIARVRAPGQGYLGDGDIAVGPDGEIYAVVLGMGPTGYNSGQVDLVRLKFYESKGDLPPVSRGENK